MKIRPVGAEFHVDGQTDMAQLIVAFHKYAKESKAPYTLSVKLSDFTV
jgi:hypothetical protein